MNGLTPVQRLEELASRAQRFSPRVSLAPPDGLLLEVAGSLHLFGGVAGLRRELTGECGHLQPPPVLAFAPTPLAALTAARAGRALVIEDPAQLVGLLAPLPIAALRWPEETCARLARAGVRTIGAVLRLPRAGFARRFGVAQLATLDALTGRSREVRATHRSALRFRRRHELDCELSDHGRLHAALEPLLAALGAFLTTHQCGVAQLECRLLHRNGAPTSCRLSLAASRADAPQLSALFRERLSLLQLREPVRALELRADQLLPQRSPCRGLWQLGEQGGEAAEESEGLIDRLCARLGEGAVHGLARRAEHRPECAWAVTSPPALAARRATTRRAAAAEHAGPPARPLWLLPAPQPLAAQGGLPRRRGALRLLSEPERIETGWWDGGEIARDYYVAIDRHGVRLWVFREREEPHRWFLHGIFG
ncbi:MAG: DNA polymerase Y family protein [Gammaproteobacteria bacterium]|nr:DNA polymerase Y family protein [Gammaproteobacteria bacterium]